MRTHVPFIDCSWRRTHAPNFGLERLDHVQIIILARHAVHCFGLVDSERLMLSESGAACWKAGWPAWCSTMRRISRAFQMDIVR